MQRVIELIEATGMPATMSLPWVWPVAEALHFTGLVLLVGGIGLFDLRVLGLFRGVAPSVIHRLVPIGVAGFALSAATGAAFIAGTPDQYFYNTAFHWKVVFLAVMGANAAFFYLAPYRQVASLDAHGAAPLAARLSAAVSLAAMVAVMSCGRMLTFFRPPSAF